MGTIRLRRPPLSIDTTDMSSIDTRDVYSIDV
jgi:hypothetical protein